MADELINDNAKTKAILKNFDETLCKKSNKFEMKIMWKEIEEAYIKKV